MMDMECMLYIRTRIPMLVKYSSVRARSDWLAGGGSDVSGKVAPLPNPPGLVWSPTPQPQGLACPSSGKRLPRCLADHQLPWPVVGSVGACTLISAVISTWHHRDL